MFLASPVLFLTCALALSAQGFRAVSGSSQFSGRRAPTVAGLAHFAARPTTQRAMNGAKLSALVSRIGALTTLHAPAAQLAAQSAAEAQAPEALETAVESSREPAPEDSAREDVALERLRQSLSVMSVEQIENLSIGEIHALSQSVFDGLKSAQGSVVEVPAAKGAAEVVVLEPAKPSRLQRVKEVSKALLSLPRAIKNRELAPGVLGEGQLAMLLALWQFATIGAYNIISPIKKGFLLFSDPIMMPLSYIISPAVTVAAAWVFSRFSYWPRKKLITWTMGSLAASTVFWWGMIGWGQEIAPLKAHWDWVRLSFALWGDVFSGLSVSLLWMYANDVFKPSARKRVFGMILVGASLGAIAFSALPAFLMPIVGGPTPLLLISAIVYSSALLIFAGAERIAPRRGLQLGADGDAEAALSSGNWAAVKEIFKDRFLLLLGALVALERILPTITDWMLANQWKAENPTATAKDYSEFRARFSMLQNVFGLVANAIAVPLLLKFLGTGSTLVAAALLTFVGFVAFSIVPTLAVALPFVLLDGLQRYTWFKASKEGLFNLLDRQVLYRVKPVIDLFFYRAGNSLAGFLILLVTATVFGAGWALGVSAGMRTLAAVAVAFSTLGVYVTLKLRKLAGNLESAIPNDERK